MNNYCSNCGKKLKPRVYCCPDCKTPVIDLSKIYPKKENKISNTFLKVIGIIMLVAGVIVVALIITAFAFKYKYVKPYLKSTYGDNVESIKFVSIGRCTSSGDCYVDPVMGCDGGACTPYTYVDGCVSFLYSFNYGGKKEKVNVSINSKGIETNLGEHIYVPEVPIEESKVEDDTTSYEKPKKETSSKPSVHIQDYQIIKWSGNLPLQLDGTTEYGIDNYVVNVTMLNDDNFIVYLQNKNANYSKDSGVNVVFYGKSHTKIASTGIIPFETKNNTEKLSSEVFSLKNMGIKFEDIDRILIAVYRQK